MGAKHIADPILRVERKNTKSSFSLFYYRSSSKIYSISFILIGFELLVLGLLFTGTSRDALFCTDSFDVSEILSSRT